MKLSVDLLERTPVFCSPFVSSTVEQKYKFFHELKKLATQDLSLAHSVFKVSSCRTILSLSDHKKFQELATQTFVGGFSVHKPFDTAQVVDNLATGRKHWISNLEQAEFVIVQLQHNAEVKLFYADLSGETYHKDFSFLNTPGLKDTCTGDLEFDNHPVELIFSKADPRYFVSNNHNSLCFITNYLGAVGGLLEYVDIAEFKAQLRNLSTLIDYEIKTTSGSTVSSENFWHSRNALYLDSKNLLVATCQRIIRDHAGEFYNLNSLQGQHFFNCLMFSGHNGPISRSYQQLFTESQDY